MFALADPYIQEIAQHDLLTAEEEVALAQRVEAGHQARAELEGAGAHLSLERRAELEALVGDGRRARGRLIECNLRLVVSIAARYRDHGLQLVDLIQEGNIGLHIGAERFDWRRGFRFSTYVYWWIRQAVTRAISDKSRAIRLPAHATDLLTRAARA